MLMSARQLPLRLFFAIMLSISLTIPSTRLSIGCEPDANDNLPSIEILFGAIEPASEEPTAQEKKSVDLGRLTEERARIQRERLEQDLRRTTDRLQTDLDNVKIWTHRASLYEKLKRYDAAISDLNEAMKRQGESPDLLIRRAHMWLGKNEFEPAESDAEKAIELDPKSAAGYFALGEVFREQWKIQEAFDNYSKAIKINPKHKMARYNRAYVIIGGRPDKKGLQLAVDDLKQVIELDPEMLKAHFDLVEVLYATRQLEEAARVADYVQTQDPDLECLYLLRWKIHSQLEKYDLAIYDATRYMAFKPEIVSRIRLRAKSYYALREFEKSIADWNVYIESEPNAIDGHYFRGRCYDELWMFDKALEDWNALISLQPDNPDHLIERSRTYVSMHRYDDAFADIDKAEGVNPLSPQYWNLRQSVYQTMGEDAKARFANWMARTHTHRRQNTMSKYYREQDEEKRQLVQHVVEEVAAHRHGQSLDITAFRKFTNNDAYIPVWLGEITPLLTTPNEAVQKRGMEAMQTFLRYVMVQPVTEIDIAPTMAALDAIVEGDHSEEMKQDALILRKGLPVLVEINDPNTFKNHVNPISFDRFEYSADEEGRAGYFKYVGAVPVMWDELKFNGSGKVRVFDVYKEVGRTTEYVEMYSYRTGTWVRLGKTKYEKSTDRSEWKLVGEGESYTKNVKKPPTYSGKALIRVSEDD